MSVVSPGEVFAKRDVHLLKDARLKEEALNIFRLGFYYLFYQIVRDISMAAGERSNELLNIVAAF